MNSKSNIGNIVGKITLVIAALCFAITPGFSPAIGLAALVGTCGGVIAIIFGAHRMALVTMAIAVTPFCGLLFLQFAYQPAMSSYLVVVPLIAVVLIAALAVINHLRHKSGGTRVA